MGTLDGIIIGALLVVEVFWARRALWGKPPARQWRFGVVCLVCGCIHLGFHAAATAAPSLLSVASFVLAGWLTFTLWLVWLSRAPKPERGDGGEGGGGGGPGGDGDDGRGDGPAGDGEHEFDWDAFEREFWPYVRERERRERPGVTPPSPAGS